MFKTCFGEHFGEADRFGPTQNSKIFINQTNVFIENMFEIVGVAYVLRVQESQEKNTFSRNNKNPLF